MDVGRWSEWHSDIFAGRMLDAGFAHRSLGEGDLSRSPDRAGWIQNKKPLTGGRSTAFAVGRG